MNGKLRLLTIRLEEGRHRALKMRAAEEGRSMQEIAAQAIAQVVESPRKPKAR